MAEDFVCRYRIALLKRMISVLNAWRMFRMNRDKTNFHSFPEDFRDKEERNGRKIPLGRDPRSCKRDDKVGFKFYFLNFCKSFFAEAQCTKARK